MNEEDKCHAAFSRLVEEEAFIPQWLKEGFDSGLKGGAIPSSQQIKSHASIVVHELYEELMRSGQSHGFNLTEQNKLDLKESASFCDELINISLKTKYGWGIPSEETINQLSEFLNDKEGLIEMGAGSGLWTGILKARTDKNIIGCEKNLRSDTPRAKFSRVLDADVKDLMDLYPTYPVLIVWPDTNNMPLEVAQKMTPDNHLIFAGSPWVTGSNDFYKELDLNFKRVTSFESCSFSGGELDTTYILKKLPEPNLDNDSFFKNLRNMHKIKFKMKK